MFVKAYASAAKYTRPIVVSMRKLDWNVTTGFGAFVVVNADGWIVTAGHILSAVGVYQANLAKIAKYDADVDAIKAGPGNGNQKKRQLQKLKPDQTWLRNVSPWFSEDAAKLAELYVYPEIDLGLARLTGMTPPPEYPIFKDPTDMPPGTSLIRMGYPFYSIGATWDQATNGFKLDPNAVAPALFPIEGIHTRVVVAPAPGLTPQGFPIRFVETSSPGLMGQSGGPVLDSACNVWGIQSRTSTYPLGFTGTLNGKPIPEQFFNVGLAVDATTLKSVFAHHNVTAQWSPP